MPCRKHGKYLSDLCDHALVSFCQCSWSMLCLQILCLHSQAQNIAPQNANCKKARWVAWCMLPA